MSTKVWRFLISLCLLLCFSNAWATLPKMEGRFVELQNTYVSRVWTQINFQQIYDEPPAVFMLSTNQGGNPAIVRIRNITTSGFEALPLEPSGEDGEHVTMGAHYLAIEYGVHEFPDGTIVEVGSAFLTDLQYGAKSPFIGTVSKSYDSLSFQHSFSVRPNFFHSLQTLESLDSNPPYEALIPFFTIAVESGSLSATGVNVALEASQTEKGTINEEKMAYLAVEPGTGRVFSDDDGNIVEWESFFTGFNVVGWDDECVTFSFTNEYTAEPLVMASNNSRDGNDGGWLRSCELTSTYLGLVVDEDRSVDRERSHGKEEASILAMRGNFIVREQVVQCDDLFPGALATYNNSNIQLFGGVTITDENARLLTTESLTLTGMGIQCNGQTCVATGSNAITEEEAASLPRVDNDGSSSYPLSSSLAGDYFLDRNAVAMNNRTFEVTAPTRIFIKNSSTATSKAEFSIINSIFNVQSGAYLSVYVDGNVTLGSNINLPIMLFATGNIAIGEQVNLMGSITAGGQITANANSTFTALPVPNNIPGICGIDTPSILDHYRLTLSDGNGLTCAPKEITLTACGNDNCDLFYDQPTTLDLSPDETVEQSWVTGETVSFTGTTEVLFAKNSVGSVNLGYNTASPSAPIRCYISGVNVGLNGCTVTFTDSGFIFKNLTAGNTTIPMQLSAKPSDEGFNASQIAIQAVETNTTTGVCEGVFEQGQSVAINLSYNCSNTSTCSDSLLVSNGGNTHALTQAQQSFPLVFDEDSQAALVLNYPDAGQISLLANAELVLDSNTGLSTSLSGASNQFLVKPFAVALNISDSNAFASTSSDSLFRLTDQNFNVQMNAVQWVRGQDTDNNGEPDDLTQVNNNTIAKHFYGERPMLTASLRLPAGGVQGSLNEQTVVNFTDSGAAYSQSTSSYSYDQVGIIDLNFNLSDNDYLGGGDIYGQLNHVGRFAPAQFNISSVTAEPVCTVAGSRLTYLDQPFELGYVVQAENSAGQRMQNYIDGFAKSVVATNIENSEAGNYQSASALKPRLLNLDTVTWESGALAGQYIVSEDDLIFARTSSPDGPFEYTHLLASLSGLEGAALVNANELANSGSSCTTDCDSVRLTNLPIQFRYGRRVIDNNSGSDLNELLLPMSVEYYDGTQFVLNNEDNCTEFDKNNLTQLSPSSPVSVLQYSGSGAGSFENGSYPVNNGIYAQPNGIGIFKYEYETESWLQYDWQGDNSQLNPQGELQFGQFRGNDRVIYWREGL